MKMLFLICLVLFTLCPILATQAGFRTDFTEDTLPQEIGIDIPFDDVAEIVLDTENDELDINTFGNTDMWTERRDAPVAWLANPGVVNGATWSVETYVRYNGAEDAAQRVAGFVFYGDEDGLGGSNGGVDFSFGLNDWNNRGIEAQGLGGTEVGDSGQRFLNAEAGNPHAAFLRAEITEGGDSDEYALFYKLEAEDPWSEFARFNSDQDNSRVGLMIKTGNATAEEDASVSFTYLALDGGDDTDGDGMSDAYETANGLDPASAADRDDDADGDGLSNIVEFQKGTAANKIDTDGDGLEDGVETDTGAWVNSNDTGTNPLSPDTDGDTLPDGVETNTGTFVSATDTGTNPLAEDSDGDSSADQVEIAAGTDPTDGASFPTNTIGRGDWQVSLDIPNEALATIDLDVENNELDFVTNGNTDMWQVRNNAPVAWAPNPDIPEGEIWSVETHVRYNGAEDATQRVAGLMFYGDEDGLGGSQDGVDFSFGLNDWNNRGVEVQGLGGTQVGDSGENFINAFDDVGNPPAAFLRAEITEGGDTDAYVLYYKLEEADDWVELASFNSDQDNSRVGMVFKNGGNTAEEDRSVSFTYFLIDDGSVGPGFQITDITRSETGVTLTWTSRPGREYSLDRLLDLSTPNNWNEVDDGIASGGDSTTFTDDSAELAGAREAYYRVREN